MAQPYQLLMLNITLKYIPLDAHPAIHLLVVIQIKLYNKD